MKIIFNTIYYLTIGAVGLLGLLLVSTLIPIPGNFEAKVVKSGSMEPTIHVGSIVVIKPESSYQVGDVVTFGADTKTQIPTTHRIVAIEGQGSGAVYQTKGDANDSPDNVVVHRSDIHGKEILTVPYLGYVLAFARTKWGFLLLVGLPALLVFFEEGKNIILEIKRMRRRGRGVKREGEMEPLDIPIPIKPRIHRIKVMSLIFVSGLTLGSGMGAGSFGDTVAYYADTATSQNNKLGAAAVFPSLAAEDIASFAVILSEPVVVDESTSTTDQSASTTGSTTEETPPQDPVVEISDPVVVETPADVPPAETPTSP